MENCWNRIALLWWWWYQGCKNLSSGSTQEKDSVKHPKLSVGTVKSLHFKNKANQR